MKLTKQTIVNASLLALGLGLAGCGADKSMPKDFFPARDGNRRSEEFMTAQSKAGAHEDDMLQECHFDGTKLNSLGKNKLNALVPTEADADVTVYINLKDGDETIARRDSVRAYLKDHGVEPAHVKLEAGPNPKTDYPTAQGLANLSKADTSDDAGSSAGSPSAGTTGGTTK